MTTKPTIPTNPTTAHPCPPWCALPSGHGYDSLDADDTLLRFHERDLSRFSWPHSSEPVTTGVGVSLTQMERASADGSRVLHHWPVVITAYTKGGEELTGPQARQFAAALLDAADAWDEV